MLVVVSIRNSGRRIARQADRRDAIYRQRGSAAFTLSQATPARKPPGKAGLDLGSSQLSDTDGWVASLPPPAGRTRRGMVRAGSADLLSPAWRSHRAPAGGSETTRDRRNRRHAAARVDACRERDACARRSLFRRKGRLPPRWARATDCPSTIAVMVRVRARREKRSSSPTHWSSTTRLPRDPTSMRGESSRSGAASAPA
jgi:hypothetical protein